MTLSGSRVSENYYNGLQSASVLGDLLVVLLGVGDVFLGDGLSDFVQIWTIDVVWQTNEISFFIMTLTPRSKVKIEGQIIDFAITHERLDRFCQNFYHIINSTNN